MDTYGASRVQVMHDNDVDVVPTVEGVKFHVDRCGGHDVVDSVKGYYLRLT